MKEKSNDKIALLFDECVNGPEENAEESKSEIHPKILKVREQHILEYRGRTSRKCFNLVDFFMMQQLFV